MPIATDRLSKLQTLKLIQAVHEKNVQNIVKLIENGIPDLVNYAGRYSLQWNLTLSINIHFLVTTFYQKGKMKIIYIYRALSFSLVLEIFNYV